MMGYDAPYVPGYDCHGLPIEQHVERELEKKGKKRADLPAGELPPRLPRARRRTP